MPAKINLKNQTFGKLTVLEETDQRKNKSVVWKCQCSCGNIIFLSTKELRSDGIIQCPSCGNTRNTKNNIRENIIGKKFNHLKVLEETDKRSGGKILYKCECDCESHNIIYVNRTDLQSGHTKSCGCISRKYHIGDIINNRKILDLIGDKNNTNQYYFKCQCLFCNNIYEATTNTLDHTISCGCQKSKGEFNISQILNINNIKYQKEYQFPNSNYRFDFAIFDKKNNVIRLIEFDGEQHYQDKIKNTGWNIFEKYEQTFKNDQLKNILAKENNIPLIRIPYWERDNITLEMLMGDRFLII